jgi:hypothetical protein
MDFKITKLTQDDYESYMDLMFEFTNYKFEIVLEMFKKYVIDNNCKILVIKYKNKIIGAGTIFRINKLHNNSIGQI